MSIPLELSTKIKPGRPIDIDGARYDMLTMDHLSPEVEAEVMALFSRHATYGAQLEVAPSKAAGEKAAKSLRTVRMMLISKLTTVPREVVEGLPITAQIRLLDALRDEMQIEIEQDEDAEEDLSEETAAVAAAVAPEGGGGDDDI